MSDFATPHQDAFIDASVPLEAILRTEELRRRPTRPPDFEKENSALVALARSLVASKADILQILVEKILDVTECDSSGLSFLNKGDGGKSFHWPAIAGQWKPHTGGGTPRHCCPCGDALDRQCALLFHRFERRYTLFVPVMPAAEECLIVPFYVDGTPVGTMWAIMHSDRRKFDAEDERIMTALGQFAAVAFQTMESLDHLKTQVSAREQAEKALRRLASGAEQQARSMIEIALDAVIAMNADGLITDWNRQAQEVFGWTREEALGRRLSETIIPVHDRAAHERGLRHFLKTGEGGVLNRRVEMTAVRRDGQVFPVELTVTTLQIAESWSFHAFVRDITSRKNAEEALRASERSLDLIINTIPVLAWSARPDGFVDFFNQHFRDYCGLSLGQAQGWGWTTIVHPEDLPGAVEYWKSLMLAEAAGEYEARFRRFDGRYRWFLIRAQPLRAESGEIVRWYGTNTDIEERRSAEEALRTSESSLRESEFNLRQLTETIPAMVWSATPDGGIGYCNSRFLQYTGFSAAEVTKDGWQKAIHPEDAARAIPEWLSSVRTGAPYRVEVRTFHAADGSYRWCLVSALPLLDPQGHIVKWYGTIWDMHDWKRAQEELRDMQAELAHVTRVLTMGELTASIAHEVSQPLAAAIASSDSCTAWLAASPPNVERAQTAADRTVQAVTQASAVLQRTRTMFKKAPAVRVRLEINDVISEAVSLIQSELTSKRISFQTELADSTKAVLGDRVQIAQVVLNLAINGIEAMSKLENAPRRLIIQSAEEPEEVRVAVADSGPGLDPDMAGRLFNPFVTTKPDGIGMGLSISRSIIEAHGGRLWLTANQPRGAIFHFALPATSSK